MVVGEKQDRYLKNRRVRNKPLNFLVMVSRDLHIKTVKTVVDEGPTAVSWELLLSECGADLYLEWWRRFVGVGDES